MKIVRSFDDIERDTSSIVTVGSFDGVHLAHREILREVVQRARMREGRSVVVTFDPHPSEVVTSPRGRVGLLTTLGERIALLEHLNIDILFVIDFTVEFSRLTPREFYQTYVVDRIGLSEVVVGYDHMFGRNREAGVRELVSMGQLFHFSVFAAHPYVLEGVTVSSTEIRTMLLQGRVERAALFLTYPYFLTGKVVPGDGRGKSIGYPTANIQPLSTRKIAPGRGVYLVGAELRGRQYFGMMNIGLRPTVSNGMDEKLEVHIFDLKEEIYGEKITIMFLRRLRDEQKFSSIQDLMGQLAKDKEVSLKHIPQYKRQL